MGNSSLLNTSCGFNRVSYKEGSKLHPITPENIQVYRKVLKQDSEEEAAFLLSVSKRLSQLDFSALNSVTSLDLFFETIFFFRLSIY